MRRPEFRPEHLEDELTPLDEEVEREALLKWRLWTEFPSLRGRTLRIPLREPRSSVVSKVVRLLEEEFPDLLPDLRGKVIWVPLKPFGGLAKELLEWTFTTDPPEEDEPLEDYWRRIAKRFGVSVGYVRNLWNAKEVEIYGRYWKRGPTPKQVNAILNLLSALGVETSKDMKEKVYDLSRKQATILIQRLIRLYRKTRVSKMKGKPLGDIYRTVAELVEERKEESDTELEEFS